MELMVLEKYGTYYIMHHKGLTGIYDSNRMLVKTIGGEPEAALKPGSIPVKVEPVKTPAPVKMPEPAKEPVKV